MLAGDSGAGVMDDEQEIISCDCIFRERM